MERIESLESRALLVGTASGAITGTAFIDSDRDGHLDVRPADARNEIKMPGVTVTLTGTTTTGATVAPMKVKTKADGKYTFDNVLPGIYQVQARPIDNPRVVALPLIRRNIAVMATGESTLEVAVTLATQTSIQVTNASTMFALKGFNPATGGFTLKIGSETMVVTGFNAASDTFTVTRGAGATTYSKGAIVSVAGKQTATRNLAFTNQLAPQLLSVRPFRTNATANSTANFAFAAPGTGLKNVNVRENNLPELANGQPGTVDVGKNAPNEVIDLSDVINDPDGDPPDEVLTYSIVGIDNSETGLVTATIVGNQLTLNYSDTLFGTVAEPETSDITIRATDKFGATLDTVLHRNVNNKLPEVTELTFTALDPSGMPVVPSSTRPSASGKITANATTTDEDGDTVTLTYEWTVNGVVQTGPNQTGPTLDLAGVTPTPLAGQLVRVKVTPNDGTENGNTLDDATRVNSPPTEVITTLSPSSLLGTNDTLTANVTLVDVDSEPVTLTYIWKIIGNAVPIREITKIVASGTSSSSDELNLAIPGNGDIGDTITVDITLTDGKDFGTPPPTTTATVVNDAPAGTVTISDTTPTQNQLLTASNTLTDADGPGTLAITYTWERATDAGFTLGVTTVATGETFTPSDADVGQFLRVTASYTDGQGKSESVSSDVTSAVINANDAPSLLNGVPAAITVAKNAADRVIDLAGVFTDIDMTDSLVRFKTTFGTTNRDIDVTLFDTATPKTVANFFNYITSNRYDSTYFHRFINGFVLQGGGFTGTNTSLPVAKDRAVDNEFDFGEDTNQNGQLDPGENLDSDSVIDRVRTNVRGTVAMAKIGGNPNSATNEFFFNLGNNVANLDNQNGGFTVFGQVTQDTLSVLDFLTSGTPQDFVRVTDVEVVRRDESLTYMIFNNTNESLVVATIENNRLVLNFAATGFGNATITVRATDQSGATFDTQFQVTVADDTAPVATGTLDPTSPTSNTVLTANVTGSDADVGDTVTLRYRWLVDGFVLKTASGSDNQLDLGAFENVNPDDVVRLEVTPNDGVADGNTLILTRVVI